MRTVTRGAFATLQCCLLDDEPCSTVAMDDHVAGAVVRTSCRATMVRRQRGHRP